MATTLPPPAPPSAPPSTAPSSPTFAPSPALALRAFARDWTVCLRHAPVGFVGVALILALGLATGLLLARSRSGPLTLSIAIVPALITGLAQFFGAALVGSAVGDIESRLQRLRTPAGPQRLRRAAAAAALVLWLPPAVLWLAVPAHGHAGWLWPVQAAIGALAIGLGLSLTLSRWRRQQGLAMVVGMIALTTLGSGFAPVVAGLPAAASGWQWAAALVSLAAIGLVAAGILRWMRTPAARPAPTFDGESPTAPVATGPLRLDPGDPLDALVMPGPVRIRRADMLIALVFALFYGAMVRWWLPELGLMLMVLLAWSAMLDGAVYARSGGLSARALVLPGGLHRPDLLRRVFWMAWRRSWRRSLVLTVPPVLVLWALTEARPADVVALVPALGGALLWGCALAAALFAVTPATRQLVTVSGPGLLLFGSAWWMSAPTSSIVTATPSDVLAWGVGTGALGALLAAFTLVLAARATRRVDGRRLGPLPDRPGIGG